MKIALDWRPEGRPTVEPKPKGDVDLSGLPERFMNPGELQSMIWLLRTFNVITMIETGVNTGRTAAAILRNVPSIKRYIGIDVPPTYVPSKSVQRKEVPEAPGHLAMHDKRFRLLLSGRGTFDIAPYELPQCEAVFIDGDHSEAGVRRDWELAQQIVRKGGVVIFHDDHGSDVVDVTHVLNDIHSDERPVFHIANTWLSFVRM